MIRKVTVLAILLLLVFVTLPGKAQDKAQKIDDLMNSYLHPPG